MFLPKTPAEPQGSGGRFLGIAYAGLVDRRRILTANDADKKLDLIGVICVYLRLNCSLIVAVFAVE